MWIIFVFWFAHLWDLCWGLTIWHISQYIINQLWLRETCKSICMQAHKSLANLDLHILVVDVNKQESKLVEITILGKRHTCKNGKTFEVWLLSQSIVQPYITCHINEVLAINIRNRGLNYLGCGTKSHLLWRSSLIPPSSGFYQEDLLTSRQTQQGPHFLYNSYVSRDYFTTQNTFSLSFHILSQQPSLSSPFPPAFIFHPFLGPSSWLK